MKKILLTLALASATALAFAEPLKIRFWSGFPAGGATDQQIRILQKCITETSANTIVTVEYRPGAAGVVGFKQFVAHQPTDYVELLMDGSNQLISAYITKTNNLDPTEHVKIIAAVGYIQEVIMASRASSIASIADLKRKKSIVYGSAGVGSVSHITTAYLENYISNEFVHVPYKSPPQAVPDLINGRIDLLADYVSSGITQVRAGTVVPIAVTGSKRTPLIPTVKTLQEQGVKDFPIDPWYAVFSHLNNDPVKTLQASQLIDACLQNPRIQQEYADRGVIVPIDQSPRTWYRAQVERYQRIAQHPKFKSLQ
jgi:tripartite-type tricarboxylate transporter receptor subunit TctC